MCVTVSPMPLVVYTIPEPDAAPADIRSWQGRVVSWLQEHVGRYNLETAVAEYALCAPSTDSEKLMFRVFSEDGTEALGATTNNEENKATWVSNDASSVITEGAIVDKQQRPIWALLAHILYLNQYNKFQQLKQEYCKQVTHFKLAKLSDDQSASRSLVQKFIGCRVSYKKEDQLRLTVKLRSFKDGLSCYKDVFLKQLEGEKSPTNDEVSSLADGSADTKKELDFHEHSFIENPIAKAPGALDDTLASLRVMSPKSFLELVWSLSSGSLTVAGTDTGSPVALATE